MEEQGKKKTQSGFMIFVKLMVMFVLLGYIVFSMIKGKTWGNNSPCKNLVICIEDSAYASFITKDDLQDVLDKKHLNPIGKPMDQVKLSDMERELKKLQFILELHCYKTADDAVHVDVEQRLPVLRIMSESGDNYFIDGKGDRMKGVMFPADVIVATGAVNSKYAKKYLAQMGKLFQEDNFWNSQIEQVNVKEDGTVDLIPRVGNHVVFLGQPEDVATKLSKLKVFYESVMSKVGWNKYSRISLEYSNQIICTKTE